MHWGEWYLGRIKKEHLGEIQKREKEEKDTGCIGDFLKQTKKGRVFKSEKPMNIYFKFVYIVVVCWLL